MFFFFFRFSSPRMQLKIPTLATMAMRAAAMTSVTDQRRGAQRHKDQARSSGKVAIDLSFGLFLSIVLTREGVYTHFLGLLTPRVSLLSVFALFLSHYVRVQCQGLSLCTSMEGGDGNHSHASLHSSLCSRGEWRSEAN
jgi:hypothetical protein